MTDQIRDKAIIEVRKGNKVYSHQRLVQLYMKHSKLSLEDAIDSVDFDMAFYKIEIESH